MLNIIFYIYFLFFVILQLVKIFVYIWSFLFLNIIDFFYIFNIHSDYLIEIVSYLFNLPIFHIQLKIFNLLFFLQSFYNTLTYDINYIINYLIFISQVLFIVIITIWTRAAGPRFRLDQLLSLTWKDLFIYLSLFLVFILFIVVLV